MDDGRTNKQMGKLNRRGRNKLPPGLPHLRVPLWMGVGSAAVGSGLWAVGRSEIDRLSL
jgi:hypothetical protein